MNAKVSIITPTYNRCYLLPRLWQSIAAQTFESFCWIVVDDGSTDGTKAFIDNINDERIKYVRQENQGQNFARNRGIQENRSDYAIFIDSDDEFFDENVVAEMVIEIERAPVSVGVVAFKTVDHNGHPNTCFLSQSPLIANYQDIICKARIRGEFLYIFKKKVLEQDKWPLINGLPLLMLWNVSRHTEILYSGKVGRIYHIDLSKLHDSKCDNISGAFQTIRRAESMAYGHEMLLEQHGGALKRFCLRQYGIKQFYCAFYFALCGQERKLIKHLMQSWLAKGPKKKIIILFAALFIPLRLRHRFFIWKTRLGFR